MNNDQRSRPSLTNCSFQANSASSSGGGMFNLASSSPTLTNCSFRANSARSGGGMANFSSSSSVTNCSFQANSTSQYGGGMFNDNGNLTLTNCVLFGNGGSNTIYITTGSVSASYSLFENGETDFTGSNNLTGMTISPFASTTSTQLSACAPAINAGDPATTMATVGSTDLAGNPRFYNNGRIDMGAYEFQGTPNSPIAITTQPSAGSAVCVGGSVTTSVSVTGTGPYTYQWYKDGSPVSPAQSSSVLSLNNVQVTDGGSYSARITGACDSVTSTAFSLTVNAPPTADLTNNGPLTCSQTSVTLTASGGSTYTFTSPGGTVLAGSGNTRMVSSAGSYSVTVTSANGCTATASVIVTGESNTPPMITTLTVGTGPQAINTAFAFNAQVSDASNNLTTASIAWGDGSTTNLTPAAGGGTLSATHPYTTAGVYRVSLTLTDACGATATQTYEYAVAYDPAAGFVTGAGWIESPAGAYVADASLTGKAHFGFQARYQKGATVPTGNTDFQFKAGSLDFKSTVYEWLTVAGARAQFKGSGTINGAGDYGFMLTGIDGAVNGGGGTDKFRIKIWQKQTGALVYDNQRNTADDAVLSTVISGGQIVIHTPTGKNAREASSEELGELSVQVLGNPVRGRQVEALIGGAAGQVLRISLVNLQGHTLDQQQVEQAGPQQRVVLQIGTTPGVYLLRVSTQGQTKTVRLLNKLAPGCPCHPPPGRLR
jgi:hypothetical protein